LLNSFLQSGLDQPQLDQAQVAGIEAGRLTLMGERPDLCQLLAQGQIWLLDKLPDGWVPFARIQLPLS